MKSTADFQVTIDGHRFRVVQIILESGEREISATNLEKNIPLARIQRIKLVTDDMIIEDIDRNKSSGRVYKHDYKTNENVLIGSLKDKLIFSILFHNKNERNIWLDGLTRLAPDEELHLLKIVVSIEIKVLEIKLQKNPNMPFESLS